MRTWRVGTLTMGGTLLFLGIGLLYAQLNEKLVLDWAINWWPLVFIFLGIEVLWQSYHAKKTNTQVGYDILSVFIIGVLLCFGLAMQALSETGFIEQCNTILVSENYELQKTSTEIPMDAGLKEVVIERSANPLEIISRSTDKITASCKAEVRAPSRNAALQLLQECQGLETRREGDTLYLAFTSSYPASHISAGLIGQKNTLYLPEQLKVSIYSGASDIQIHARNILNDWYINGTQSLAVDFASTSSIQLMAQVNSRNDLQGNASWTVKEETPTDSEKPSSSSGTLNVGSGQHKMMIKSNGQVSVDILP